MKTNRRSVLKGFLGGLANIPFIGQKCVIPEITKEQEKPNNEYYNPDLVLNSQGHPKAIMKVWFNNCIPLRKGMVVCCRDNQTTWVDVPDYNNYTFFGLAIKDYPASKNGQMIEVYV